MSLRSLSLGTRPSTCAFDSRACRAALATLTARTMKGHCTSEKPPFLRRQPVLPRASPAPYCARWLARVARLRATALALSGDEAQHVRFRRARAPRRAGDTRSTHHGRALHEREAAVPSAPARAPTCQPCPSLREVACACSALARHCARSLWGRGPARALPTRAPRRAGDTRFTHCGRALHEREAAVPSAPARAPTC